MFMDDDVVFFKDTFKNMNNFIKKIKMIFQLLHLDLIKLKILKKIFLKKLKK